ncbi:hypothetical protein DM01DRAFT_1385465 [Hesseltinella vesiculosa]|uniref:Uncharacterized protein n=1 Tax=Hesseltinella vesiculosa TaxID=101127 RepID=A0A1X2G9H6_9FUNG|nr:hypothetical protein DM01DRAFT_1385465 [Hesseltinella vesiculosa]
MSTLHQSPPLVVLGQGDFDKVQLYLHEPVTSISSPPKNTMIFHMLELFGTLELVLHRIQRLKSWDLDNDDETKALAVETERIKRAIDHVCHNAGLLDQNSIQSQLEEWNAHHLYPLAVEHLGFDLAPSEPSSLRSRYDQSIQAHYQHMSILTQMLASCQCLLTAVALDFDGTKVANHLALLHTYMIVSHQPNFIGHKKRIEQLFPEILATKTLAKEQKHSVEALANEIQGSILHATIKDQYSTIRGCSSLFDLSKTSIVTAE